MVSTRSLFCMSFTTLHAILLVLLFYISDFSKRNSVLSDSDNSLSPSSVKSEDSLEIMSISASAVKYSAVKCGPLFKKEKVLFVEHTKRLWVALLGTTLYVYTSEKDAKPIHNINVDEYNARPIAVSQSSKNKEFGFEIICPGKKTFQVSVRRENRSIRIA